MARGWESKAVESQIEAASTRSEQAKIHQLEAAELSRLREKESLELSRTRVLQDLDKAINPRYQEMLKLSLRFLEDKIATLEVPATGVKKKMKHHA